MRERQKNFIALSIFPQILLVKILAQFPGFVESFYSEGLYPLISVTMRYVFGWIPVSVGDMLYTLAGIYLIRWVLIKRKQIIKDTKLWFRDVFMALSIVYLLFHLLWGFNYYRLPLHKKLNIDNSYTTEELIQAIDLLSAETNELHSSLVEADSIPVEMPYGKKQLISESIAGFEGLADSLSFLDPAPASIKASIYSVPLTYMGFSGYLNPFTNEAQVDDIILAHKLPVTSCHEQAHQLGYAAENEANFIGFMASTSHPDPYHRYSGFMFGLKQCLYELARRDREAFEQKIEQVNLGIRKHYQQEQDFWKEYENPLEPLFKTTFNTFLKANSQSDGIKSYSYVVALIVNTYKPRFQ